MHVQVSRARHRGKVYEYARLVESYRKPNGVPALRVIANLGRLDATAVENLRTTLRASRAGKRVVAEREVPSSRPLKPAENLRYLDVAVLLELGRRFGLVPLLEELLPRGEADVAPSDVVMALCLQRCVDAGSKLYAERWFPRTALPELLKIVPASFHNTRIHRVLDELDAATNTLMARLPMLYASQGKAASAMYLDCTDTRFVGHGPELAEVSKTKEGLFERKVGILLLCDAKGLPLRWQVLAGRTGESPAMHRMLSSIRGLRWAGTAPIVIDRILGTGADIRKVLSNGVRLVTALRSAENETYAPDLPHAQLKDLGCSAVATDAEVQACASEARRRIGAAGFEEVSPNLWVHDVGKVQLDAPQADNGNNSNEAHGVRALGLIREIRRRVEQGESDTYRGAARKLGLSKDLVRWYRPLLKLDEQIQDEVLAGTFGNVSISCLLRVAALSEAQEQRRALHAAAVAPPPMAASVTTAESCTTCSDPEENNASRTVRVVACFNPERFVEQRRSAQQLLDSVQLAISKLNQQLANPNAKRTHKRVERAVERILERKKVSGLFSVHVQLSDQASGHYEARVELKLPKWRTRCRYHGFMLVIAHPELEQSAVQLAELYRAKDQVEKDFQTIKSLIRLRPVWHHTDRKVRAHVTICVLALLLERLLSDALPGWTTGHALEALETCRLNRFDGQQASHYLVTEPTTQQAAMLRGLGMASLLDDDLISAQIQPRTSGFVSTLDQNPG